MAPAKRIRWIRCQVEWSRSADRDGLGWPPRPGHSLPKPYQDPLCEVCNASSGIDGSSGIDVHKVKCSRNYTPTNITWNWTPPCS